MVSHNTSGNNEENHRKFLVRIVGNRQLQRTPLV